MCSSSSSSSVCVCWQEAAETTALRGSADAKREGKLSAWIGRDGLYSQRACEEEECSRPSR